MTKTFHPYYCDCASCLGENDPPEGEREDCAFCPSKRKFASLGDECPDCGRNRVTGDPMPVDSQEE